MVPSAGRGDGGWGLEVSTTSGEGHAEHSAQVWSRANSQAMWRAGNQLPRKSGIAFCHIWGRSVFS